MYLSRVFKENIIDLRSVIKVMKPFRDLRMNIKRLNNKTWNFIFKYSSHIYLSAGLIIAFMLFTLWDNMSWVNDVNSLKQEKNLIHMQLKEAHAEIGEQVDVILIQGRIINEHEGSLREAEGIIRSQGFIFRKLIELLKGSEKEFPEPKPIDPNRITRLGDILYENYQSN